MLRLRSILAASVAALLLVGGPARAVITQPAGGGPATRPLARRTTPARLGATRATPSRPAAHLLQAATLLAVVQPDDNQPPSLLVVAAPEVVVPHQVCLTGTVLDPNGRPCPGVCVFPAANPRQIAVTNAEGTFQLQVLTHMALHLQAEYLGQGSGQVALADYAGQPVRMVLGH